MTTDPPGIGAIVQGRVIRFIGKKGRSALLDIGNGLQASVDGAQLSWLNKEAKAIEVLKIGEELEVMVIKVKYSEPSRVFVCASRMQIEENPWKTVEEKHPVGSREMARVVGFLQFGAIVELPSGFRALVHNSEVSWTERKPKAQDILHLGDGIEVVIKLVDKAKRRINATYRDTIENPWKVFLDRFPIGTVTTGRVAAVSDYGVFLRLTNGCTGFLHKSRIPLGLSPISPGQSMRVVVLAYDQEKRRITLGCPPAL